MLMIKPLSYTQDSAYWFSKIAHLDWPIWLDSCAPLSSGRFDILAANPYKKSSTTIIKPIAPMQQATRFKSQHSIHLVLLKNTFNKSIPTSPYQKIITCLFAAGL
ncbi:hypothetical protein [Piscirickettsia salmonis]|uniref:hypothetical protein n=1 Tax=Piscirickettsia salmonis TaxID=1238 RepID=UPI00094A1EAB|nr:hypothetical protein [Piscirickettsia salmonis]APS55794.1 hypothetical protein AVI52_00035 [Piscirickettsia salmonis]